MTAINMNQFEEIKTLMLVRFGHGLLLSKSQKLEKRYYVITGMYHYIYVISVNAILIDYGNKTMDLSWIDLWVNVLITRPKNIRMNLVESTYRK